MKAYLELEQRFARMSNIGGAMAMLGWDQSAMMPEGGAGARAAQLAELAVLRHEMLVDGKVADLLARAEGREMARLKPWQKANLREMRRAWRHASALSPALVAHRSNITNACEMVWRKARKANDFKSFMPSFRKVIDVTREVAQAKSAAFGLSAYDALIDEYEPDGRSAEIDRLFAELESFLPGLITRAVEASRRGPKALPLKGPFPTEKQRALGLEFMAALGFDFHHGRLDVSLHPFTGGVPEDVRITTRYTEDDFTKALMGVLHETGHALYELGLPHRWAGQPVGEARGMVMHESQSLLVEMQLCRSHAFLSWASPRMRRAFNGKGKAWSDENIRRTYNRVRPGLIRVDADEVTYPAHIILRYKIEQDLLTGALPVRDLPAAWAEGMRNLLDVKVPNDRDGCLQDIHWPTGSFGYFPTYSLGALAAAQLFAAARAKQAGLESAIGKGNFAPLRNWLARHVHSLGSSASTAEIIRKATGAVLGTKAFRAHLEKRYLSST